MARQLRIEYEGACYHVMSRGNTGQAVFQDDEDRERFLETLWGCCERTGWFVHAYALMTNHYHVLIETPEANLVAGMKWFQGVSTQRYNARHHRRGHLYQGRYKALLVDDEDKNYFLSASNYIHLNPVRAGLVDPEVQPIESYPWSSAVHFLTPPSKRPTGLSLKRVLGCLNCRDVRKDRKAYLDWLNQRAAEECCPELAKELKEERKGLGRGWCFGSTEFRDKMLSMLDGEGSDNFRGDQRTEHGKRGARELLNTALSQLKLTEEEIRSMRQNELKKQAVAWLLKKRSILTHGQISELLNMGCRMNITRAIERFDRHEDGQTKKIRTLMLQCAG